MTRILVAIDGSDPAERALSFAFDTYADDADTDLVAVSVVDPTAFVHGSVDMIPPSVDTWREDAEAAARSVLEAASERARSRGVDLATDLVDGSPARAIVQYAQDHDVDQVVVGSHGRDGVSRVLLGSVAETVVRRSPVPVTVVR